VCRTPQLAPLDKYSSTNAIVETVLKTIKLESIWQTRLPNHRQATNAISKLIDGFYNSRRRHSSLGEKTPLHFEAET
jgi:putative transposase